MLDKKYDPNKIETTWYQIWEERGYFAPRMNTDQAAYCIMIPPPNVTGILHMGHAFQDTIMDALIRYHRMSGKSTLWQAGTDHAGIATQIVVERLINAEGKTRHDYGREQFIKQVWNWKNKSGGIITSQLRRIGASLDWKYERFTLDSGLSNAVCEVFVQLFEAGLIYRRKRLVNWDPVLLTAVSDLEVLSIEENGSLWEIRYPIIQSSVSNQINNFKYLTVATTRPETMLGDCAIAVNPEDTRYQHLIGAFVELPLTGRQIPIIADQYADPEFGTGCVKITPAHDFNDYQVWLRHQNNLNFKNQPYNGLINIFTPNATIRNNNLDENNLLPINYCGLDRYEARKQIVQDLIALNLIENIKEHRLQQPRGDRSGAVIEPYLTDQWYVRMQSLAEPAIEAVKQGAIRFVPDHWKNTYFDWLDNIQDWCISRQIWWGHRIPAWYDENNNIYVGRSENEIRKKYNLESSTQLIQDPDVLDTWFSSALWPFSTLGWPELTNRLQTFYPTSVLVTGFDIIFFWVARMIMMGIKFTNQVPFHTVYIHGLVRDAHGDKMSKSKGNVLDPLDLIDGIDLESLIKKRTQGLMQPYLADKIKRETSRDFPNGIPNFGADALRFTFAALASTGRDIKFDLDRIAGYRNFCNKLWNAARYVLLNTAGQDCGYEINIYELSAADRWIRACLNETIAAVTKAITEYRFDLAAQSLYEFTWNNFCDWYLEFSKSDLIGEHTTEATRRGTRHTLIETLEILLRLAHPIIPFITEELWQQLKLIIGIQTETIMYAPFPLADPIIEDNSSVIIIEWIQQCILGIRKIRSEKKLAPGKLVPILIINASAQEQAWLVNNQFYLNSLARISSLQFLSEDYSLSNSIFTLIGTMKIVIPLSGFTDQAIENKNLDQEINRLNTEIERLNQKLTTQNFLERAPAPVIQKERVKLNEFINKLKTLQIQREHNI